MDLRNNYEALKVEFQFKAEELKMMEERCKRLEEEKKQKEYETQESSNYLIQDIIRKKD